jgi:hypothetical protein
MGDTEEAEEKWNDEKIIEIAEKGYGEPLPRSKKEAMEHNSGDGLADFIVIELCEAADGDHNEAARLMRRAAEQLELVAHEFERYL